MLNVLITAFEPYDRWQQNASWLSVVELTRSLPEQPKIVTRLYPVDFEKARQRLAADLEANYAQGTTRLLEGGREAMDLEIKVLRDRLRREGVTTES